MLEDKEKKEGILDRCISYCSVGSMLIISSKMDSRRTSIQKGSILSISWLLLVQFFFSFFFFYFGLPKRSRDNNNRKERERVAVSIFFLLLLLTGRKGERESRDKLA